jgi:hypothetical protein
MSPITANKVKNTVFGLRQDYSSIHGDSSKIKENVPEIIPFLNLWKSKANILRALQILLGSLSVIFSLVTTTLLNVSSSTNDNILAKISAFIAAVSIGLMTAFDLGTKSNNMMNAWRHLNASVIKFNNGECDKKYVIDAYIQGEKLIGNVTFQQQGFSPTIPESPSTPTHESPSTPTHESPSTPTHESPSTPTHQIV